MIPVNTSEVIIEPFWDICFMQLSSWEIKNAEKKIAEENPSSIYDKTENIPGEGFLIRRIWNGLNYTVIKKKSLVMERRFDIECPLYDEVVFDAAVTSNVRLVLTAKTDKGVFSKEYRGDDEQKKEFTLAIEGQILKSVSIELYADDDADGRFIWLMLRSTKQKEEERKRKIYPDKSWKGYIKESCDMSFKPRSGIFAGKEDIDTLRKSISQHNLQHLYNTAKDAAEPEQFCEKFLNSDKRFSPYEFMDNELLGKAQTIALAGLLCRDSALCKKALRYILTIACCENWTEAFLCGARGMIFEHKAFAPSVACSDIAVVTELCGEMLEERGIRFLLRRLCEEGLARINSIVWKYSGDGENIFKMNQLAWFSNGRLPAYSLLEEYMPAIKPYSKLAFEELVKSINMIILQDGGYAEGIGYFISVSHYCAMALYKYARAHRLDFSKCLPEKFLNTADYVEALVSLDPSVDYIPICDAHPCVSATRYAAVAMMMPGTHWVTLFRRAWERENGFNSDIFTLLIEPQIEKNPPAKYRSFIHLPYCGVVSSVRRLNGELLKILVWGGVHSSAHQHKDKGSFVLQYAGETVFADPGIGEYSHNVGGSMWSEKWHSLLTPVSGEKILHQCNIKSDIIPQANGDGTAFYVKTDVLPAWDNVFHYYTRELISTDPSMLTIRDDYSLIEYDCAEFSLITPMEVNCSEESVKITGENSITNVILPENTFVNVMTLPEYGNRKYTRISIINNKKQCVQEVKFTFERR